jgi:hypothetical protein
MTEAMTEAMTEEYRSIGSLHRGQSPSVLPTLAQQLLHKSRSSDAYLVCARCGP